MSPTVDLNLRSTELLTTPILLYRQFRNNFFKINLNNSDKKQFIIDNLHGF